MGEARHLGMGIGATGGHYVVGVETSMTERSPWLRQLPPMVVNEVRRRRGVLLAGATGRVLDLDTPGALTLVEAAVGEDVPDDERYDTIVCTCRLIVVPDLLRAAVGMSRLLASGGDLQLIEPVNRAGSVGLLTSSAGAMLPAVEGLHLARDVPAAVRATGLTVVDLERFTIPTLVWPLRRFVQARARLITAETSGQGGAPVGGPSDGQRDDDRRVAEGASA
jgi:hypothetical protein